MLSYFSITIKLYFRMHFTVWVHTTELFYMFFIIQNVWAHPSWVGNTACWALVMAWHKRFSSATSFFLFIGRVGRRYISSFAVVGVIKWHLLCRQPLQTTFYFLLPLGSWPYCAVRQPYCSLCFMYRLLI